MNGKQSRALRRFAAKHTIGMSPATTRKAYRIAKKNYKRFAQNGGKLK